jgi:hypothetical protein
MLDTLVAITSILGSLSLVVSVLLLIRELRESRRLARASNAQALVGMSATYYLGLIQDRSLAELASRSGGFEEFDPIDKDRYRRLLIWWLIFYENVYYQHRHGLLESGTFRAWWRDLFLFLQEHHVARFWGDLRPLFLEGFAREIDGLLERERLEMPLTPVP